MTASPSPGHVRAWLAPPRPADVEVVAPSEINEALDRLARNDVRYRFVIDMSRA